MNSSSPFKIAVWLLLCLIWGSTWVVIKIGLGDLPPLGFAATRFFLAVVILYVILRALKVPLPATLAQWKLMAVTGVLQFSVTYSLVFWAEQHISSGLTAVLQATISVFGLLLAWKFLPNERITPLKVAAVVLGLAGVAVIFSDQLRVQDTMAFWGSVAVIVSAYAASQSSILIKAQGAGIHPGAMVWSQMVCGLPPVIVWSLISEGSPLAYRWTWQAVACVLYLTVVGTVAAFWLFYWLLERVESNQAMMISVVTPLIAVLIGWLVLGETLPAQTAIGGALILGSIALIVVRQSAPRPAS
jgi:drug/metabolite transporter (DMT)-like permease